MSTTSKGALCGVKSEGYLFFGVSFGFAIFDTFQQDQAINIHVQTGLRITVLCEFQRNLRRE